MTTALTGQLEAHALAAMPSLPATEAGEVARRFAFDVAALRPGAVVDTDRGFVQHCPDARFPRHPYLRLDDHRRFSRRELGELHDVRDDLPAGLGSGGEGAGDWATDG